MMRLLRWLILICGFACDARAVETIHVFVALADNASQGIVPVPAKIGDGDKPEANLYWGCDEGVRSWFSRSKRWRRVAGPVSPQPDILERVVFRHAEKDAWLVADAWRGREIRRCLQGYVRAAAGEDVEEVRVGETILKAGGASALVAYIGHNGLMEFEVEWMARQSQVPKPVVTLCCLSQSYFSEKLRQAGARPLLSTTQLMYPGAFILHDALEVWLKDRDGRGVRDAAARAYAKNQGISVRAASGVFAVE